MENEIEDLNDLATYKKALGGFDWYFDYSDDHRVWTRGNNRLKVLREFATKSPEHEAEFKLYRPHEIF